ncbi:MAG: 4Fe-4S cluster-binding domain-containing protein [Alphaproteobacteria bacterium]|nr:4Fe-4S cluster-binding domain-containing protein [Alphaproteobacteria bacterium]
MTESVSQNPFLLDVAIRHTRVEIFSARAKKTGKPLKPKAEYNKAVGGYDGEFRLNQPGVILPDILRDQEKNIIVFPRKLTDTASILHVTFPGHEGKPDGLTSEVSLIKLEDEPPFTHQLTLSAQFEGCDFKCKHCASKNKNSEGNVSPEQFAIIAAQFLNEGPQAARKDARVKVSMTGEGDPGRNADNVIEFIKAAPRLFPQIKRIVISTAGDLEGIRKFTRAAPSFEVEVELQVSAHGRKKAPVEGKPQGRERIVPFPARVDTPDLIRESALFHAALPEASRVPVRVNWVLVNGVNDSHEDAKYLSQLDPDVFRVTVVSLNPTDLASDFVRSDENPHGEIPATPGEIRNFVSLAQALNLQGPRIDHYIDPAAEHGAGCGQVATGQQKLIMPLQALAVT